MQNVVLGIGAFLVLAGCTLIARPSLARRMMEFFKEGRRIYLGGLIRIAVGLVILFCAPAVSLPWIPGVLGVIMILSGVALFAMGLERTRAIIEWWQASSDARLRLAMLIAPIIGVLLILSAVSF
jgi:uncharacterized membrane protein HdeD (DUF308 family)